MRAGRPNPLAALTHAALLAALPLLLNSAGYAMETPENPAPAADGRLHPLEKIAPGTVIERGAPHNWSHLIVAAYPRIGSGDVDQVSARVKQLGALLTFTMTAKVVHGSGDGEQPTYRLDRVGWGLGTRINGKNTVISYETCDRLGANLGYLGNQVLRVNEEGLAASFLQVAKTNTCCICDYGTQVLFGGDHRWMTIRHAILVSPTDGQLNTLVWLLDIRPDQTYRLAEKTLQWLPPALQEDRVFNVKSDRFTFGIPSSDAFAVVKIPQGKTMPFPLEATHLAARKSFTPSTVIALERALRTAVESGRPK